MSSTEGTVLCRGHAAQVVRFGNEPSGSCVPRSTFITLALDAGVSERNIQNSVGHRDPRQVTRYDRNRDDLSRNATHMVSAYVEGS